MGHRHVEATLFFTDIEGSTALARELGDDWADVLSAHNALVRDVFRRHHGVEARNQGDSFFAVFADPDDAVRAAIAIQRELAAHPWPHGHAVRVRMGLHRDAVIALDTDYAGLGVHLAARVMGCAHGGQIIASDNLVAAAAGHDWADLGRHILKDFPEPVALYQLNAEGLSRSFPPLVTIDARDHNLPAMVTSFVGRDAELASLRDLLVGDARLVTLTGPGGVGKTRLALEAAWSVLSRFRAGAWFVDFAAVADPDAVVDTIVETLGVRDRDQLVDRCNEGPTLLVLDNLEHLLDGVVPVAKLLVECPKLSVLATSRERLRLQGEHDVVLDGLTDSEASQLFATRAALVARDVVVDDDVVMLCRRVGGLPLAIELAAARTRSQSVPSLVTAMDRMLDALTEGERDRPARHQAMRAAIAMSVDALTEPEHNVFRRFAVFAGGATADAVAAVLTPKADEMASLVDKSLLRLTDDRYVMLEPIRQYAEERLAADAPAEYTQSVDAHARYYCDLAERLEPDLVTARQRDALDELSREHANLRLAWERGQGDVPLRMAGSLYRFWAYRGHPHEGRAVLGRVLAGGSNASPSLRAKALVGAGQLAVLQHDLDAAVPLLRDAVAVGESAWAAIAHNLLGECSRLRGDAEAAESSYAVALGIAESLGDERLVGVVQNNRGAVAYQRGDLEQAATMWELSLRSSERIGDYQAVTRTLSNLGQAKRFLGSADEANAAFRRSLDLARENHDRAGEASALVNLAVTSREGATALNPDDVALCADQIREAIVIFSELGHRRELASALLCLVDFLDDRDEALRVIDRSRAIFQELRDDNGVAEADYNREALLAASS